MHHCSCHRSRWVPSTSNTKASGLTSIGPAGLVAVKNLIEEGYDVTGFDRNSYLGGLWQYNEADQTSVMQTTVVNISKERVCAPDSEWPSIVRILILS